MYNITMYSLERIKKLLAEDGRGIKIIDSTFINMTTRATFIHPVCGEWSSTPKRVVIRKTTHPTEANANRKRSNIETRIENGEEIKEKNIKTSLARYGVPYSSQAENIKSKVQRTCLERYGTTSALAVPSVRELGKETRKRIYGDSNYTNREKAAQTCLSKYGTTNPMRHPDINLKAIKTKEAKGLITRPKGKSWTELAEELGVPRTSLQEFARSNPSEDAIERFCTVRANGYSNIEHMFSKLMNCSKYVGSVAGYRPDFQVGSVYVNVDGLYWHSQKVNREKDYHFKLRKAFESDNKRILQFRADEVKYKPQIVKSIIENANKNTQHRIGARECTLSQVPYLEARAFLQENHMMGSSKSKFLGLYKDKLLVAVMGYKKKKDVLDIDRFASLIGYNVAGGLSKIFKHLEKIYKGYTIHYWVDLRYGTGKSLEKIGFSSIRDIQSWQWTDFDKTFHRSRCKATDTLSQAENADNLKLHQIYDAGQRLYAYKISS
jgi:hypothetical protein